MLTGQIALLYIGLIEGISTGGKGNSLSPVGSRVHFKHPFEYVERCILAQAPSIMVVTNYKVRFSGNGIFDYNT